MDLLNVQNILFFLEGAKFGKHGKTIFQSLSVVGKHFVLRAREENNLQKSPSVWTENIHPDVMDAALLSVFPLVVQISFFGLKLIQMINLMFCLHSNSCC